MSDQYYQAQARRRQRAVLIIVGAIGMIACLILGTRAVYYDSCTAGFDRSPEQVAKSYLDAVQQNDTERIQMCWRHAPFYELNVGCSQVCLSRAAGRPYQIQEITVNEAALTEDNREQHSVQVVITCPASGESHRGEIVLDTIYRDLPWKHWQVISSTIGGTYARPWCP